MCSPRIDGPSCACGVRRQVSKTVREQLTARASEFHISLDDVAITDLKFGQEFAKAIESKQVAAPKPPLQSDRASCRASSPLPPHLLLLQVAQQDAERSKFIVMKAEQEKQANIIRAEGEAEARGSPRSLSQRAPMPCYTPLVPPSDCALCRPQT